MIRQLLQRVRSGTPPAPHTLAAHLLGVKDPHTGGMLFAACHLLSICSQPGAQTHTHLLSSNPVPCLHAAWMTICHAYQQTAVGFACGDAGL